MSSDLIKVAQVLAGQLVAAKLIIIYVSNGWSLL